MDEYIEMELPPETEARLEELARELNVAPQKAAEMAIEAYFRYLQIPKN